LVSNRTDGSFDLIIRRSFADYIALWMLDAGREFGLRIEG
jgi:sarcosine oxidase gamma subunit